MQVIWRVRFKLFCGTGARLVWVKSVFPGSGISGETLFYDSLKVSIAERRGSRMRLKQIIHNGNS